MNPGIISNPGIATVSYIIATILFILALGGLSHQETARRGNWYGIVGMAVALIATVLSFVTQQYALLLGALVIGGAIGLWAARRVQMTQMPELVAILHSLVGIAAVAVGFANFMDPGRLTHYVGVELTIHMLGSPSSIRWAMALPPPPPERFSKRTWSTSPLALSAWPTARAVRSHPPPAPPGMSKCS